jgi:hypothetical protein
MTDVGLEMKWGEQVSETERWPSKVPLQAIWFTARQAGQSML